MRTISIAGATGSIGSQTLEVLRSEKNFQLCAVSAYESADALVQIAQEFKPEFVVLGTEVAAKNFANQCPNIEVRLGNEGLHDLAVSADVVVNAVVGFAGLSVTLDALNAGRRVALANKESMVAGGGLVRVALQTQNAELIPVDSEHSAIHQCISNSPNEIAELVLTSTGGPFRGFTSKQLQHVTKAQALNHPTWKMGQKITVDSSTMMNKGLEIIEAHELFGVEYSSIRVVVHPQAIVHSAVTFTDGSTIAQMSRPDMRLPISYAINYPRRSSNSWAGLNWAELGNLQFETPDRGVFTALDLAESAGRRGGAAAVALNAANEVTVEAFLADEITWIDIVPVVEAVVDRAPDTAIINVNDVVEIDQQSRQRAIEQVRSRAK